MKNNDKQKFMEIMLGMADNFRDKISKEGMAIRFNMLKEYNIKQIEAAARQIMSVRKYTKMPPVAEFVEILGGGDEKDKATVEANNIIIHLKKNGSNIFPATKDIITKHLMTERWPYQNWAANILESEIKWWVKEFCEAYKAYKASEKPLQISTSKNIKKIISGVGSIL